MNSSIYPSPPKVDSNQRWRASHWSRKSLLDNIFDAHEFMAFLGAFSSEIGYKFLQFWMFLNFREMFRTWLILELKLSSYCLRLRGITWLIFLARGLSMQDEFLGNTRLNPSLKRCSNRLSLKNRTLTVRTNDFLQELSREHLMSILWVGMEIGVKTKPWHFVLQIWAQFEGVRAT